MSPIIGNPKAAKSFELLFVHDPFYRMGGELSPPVDGSPPGGLMYGQSPRHPSRMYKLFLSVKRAEVIEVTTR